MSNNHRPLPILIYLKHNDIQSQSYLVGGLYQILLSNILVLINLSMQNACTIDLINGQFIYFEIQ